MPDPTTDTTDQHTEPPYETRFGMLTAACRTVLLTADMVDIPWMRDHIGQAEALAPLIDPTGYMRGGGRNLADQGALLAAVDEFVTAVRKLDRTEQTT